ncbi:Asg7 [Kluyveromyces lactis]|nr:Asg7 [Kluyveromyces lactis]
MSTFGSTFYDSVAKNYICECGSCKIGKNVEFYMVRFFIMGFVLPVLWILNITLYLYANWIIDHNVSVPELDAETLYTEYECQQWKQRSVTSLNKSITKDFYAINNPLTFSMLTLKPPEPVPLTTYQHLSLPDPTKGGDEKNQFLESATTLDEGATDSLSFEMEDGGAKSIVTAQCLKEIASELMKNHDVNARTIRNWFLRSLCAMAGYTISIIMIVVIVKTNSQQVSYRE